MDIHALEVTFGGDRSVSLGDSPFALILALFIVLIWVLAVIEGCTVAFRGIRDTITASRGDTKPNIITRLASGLAVLAILVTGSAAFIGLITWISGTTLVFKKKTKKADTSAADAAVEDAPATDADSNPSSGTEQAR